MQELTSYTYSFEEMRKGNFLYVDKTEYIWKMIRPSVAGYFFARPRRFGKSLTLTTLKAIFQGKKELFEGLAIAEKDYSWKQYPVIHLSFGDYGANVVPPEEFINYLTSKIQKIAKEYSITLTDSMPGVALGELINTLANQEKVVILIDEYDKPILDNITNPNIAMIQKTLKGFYGILKERNEKIRFLFLTGVSKFSHVSIFSELNNLTDISMHADFATMCGYTQSEVEKHFAEEITKTAHILNVSEEELLRQMKLWYNGYRFHEHSETVYAPVSLAMFFANGGEFKEYWFTTGTPSFLLDLIKQKGCNFEKVIEEPVPYLAFMAYEVEKIDPLPLLLQTGYLTIKGTVQEFGRTFYRLGFPNYEVSSSFETYLLNAYTEIGRTDISMHALNLALQVRSGDVDAFMETMKTFFAAIPYDIQLANEKYYQTVFYLLFLLIGANIEAEVRTNKGRIDAVAAYVDNVYIFEFKINQDAQSALEQIRTKEYFRKYSDSEKRVVLIGANFDTEQRQIGDWVKEEL